MYTFRFPNVNPYQVEEIHVGMKLEDAEPNVNHLIAVIQSFLLNDTENALKNIIHYNLLFFMILHFDYFNV